MTMLASPIRLAARRRLLQLLALTAGSWGLGAPVALAQSAAAPSPSEPLQQLRIGYQKCRGQPGDRSSNRAGSRSAFRSTKIAWIEFPAGPQLLEALAVGSLEFGLTGDSPPVFAQAAGKDLRLCRRRAAQARQLRRSWC